MAAKVRIANIHNLNLFFPWEADYWRWRDRLAADYKEKLPTTTTMNKLNFKAARTDEMEKLFQDLWPKASKPFLFFVLLTWWAHILLGRRRRCVLVLFIPELIVHQSINRPLCYIITEDYINNLISFKVAQQWFADQKFLFPWPPSFLSCSNQRPSTMRPSVHLIQVACAQPLAAVGLTAASFFMLQLD